MNNFLKIKKGFSLIEVILSVSLLGLIAVSFGSVLVYNQQGSRIAGDRSRAALLAEEGLEAVRNIRDAGFSNIGAGTYSLISTGNKWGLSTTYPESIDIFRRKIDVIDISADRKRVVSTVGWTDNGNYREVVETTYLNNWMKSGLGNWASISVESGVALTGASGGIDVATEGNYAYVLRASASPYFSIVDISDTANPTLVGSCPNTNCSLSTNLQDVFVSGDYAYVTSTNGSRELQIIDISDKANPRLVGFYNTPGSSDANGLFYADNLIYLTTNYSATAGQDEFYIINVSNPASPILVDSLSLEANAFDVAVSGNYAYLASADNAREFQAINVSNPANLLLSQRYSLNLSGTANDDANSIVVGGGYAYLARNAEKKLHVVNISNPTMPVETSTPGYNISGAPYGLSLFNNNSYLAVSSNDNSQEIKILNVSDPSNISQLSGLPISGTFNGYGICYSETKDRLITIGSPTAGNSNEQILIIQPQ